MRDCPGDYRGEDAFVAAEEERLKERAQLHRMMALTVDREKIESQTVRDLGTKIYPLPPLKPWNARVLSREERLRSSRELTEMEKLKKNIANYLKKQSWRMSECGRIVPPRSKPRRCSQKPKSDNWLGRSRSRARAATLVRRASDVGALRGSMLLQRGSVIMEHMRESIRRATIRRETMTTEETRAPVSNIEAAQTLTTPNMDMSVAVQNATNSFNRLSADHPHTQL